MITPASQAYHDNSRKIPAELLPTVRHILSENPVAELGVEELAERLGVPPIEVGLTLEALRLEDGEVIG